MSVRPRRCSAKEAFGALSSCSWGNNQATSKIGQGTPLSDRPGNCSIKRSTRVGIDRRSIYVTNAVKHFKWEERGKLRLHKNPSVRRSGGLPAMAAGGNRCRSAENSALSGSDSGPLSPRAFIPGHEAEGRGAESARWATDCRDGAPCINRPHPRWQRTESGLRPLCR